MRRRKLLKQAGLSGKNKPTKGNKPIPNFNFDTGLVPTNPAKQNALLQYLKSKKQEQANDDGQAAAATRAYEQLLQEIQTKNAEGTAQSNWINGFYKFLLGDLDNNPEDNPFVRSALHGCKANKIDPKTRYTYIPEIRDYMAALQQAYMEHRKKVLNLKVKFETLGGPRTYNDCLLYYKYFLTQEPYETFSFLDDLEFMAFGPQGPDKPQAANLPDDPWKYDHTAMRSKHLGPGEQYVDRMIPDGHIPDNFINKQMEDDPNVIIGASKPNPEFVSREQLNEAANALKEQIQQWDNQGSKFTPEDVQDLIKKLLKEYPGIRPEDKQKLVNFASELTALSVTLPEHMEDDNNTNVPPKVPAMEDDVDIKAQEDKKQKKELEMKTLIKKVRDEANAMGALPETTLQNIVDYVNRNDIPKPVKQEINGHFIEYAIKQYLAKGEIHNAQEVISATVNDITRKDKQIFQQMIDKYIQQQTNVDMVEAEATNKKLKEAEKKLNNISKDIAANKNKINALMADDKSNKKGIISKAEQFADEYKKSKNPQHVMIQFQADITTLINTLPDNILNNKGKLALMTELQNTDNPSVVHAVAQKYDKLSRQSTQPTKKKK